MGDDSDGGGGVREAAEPAIADTTPSPDARAGAPGASELPMAVVESVPASEPVAIAPARPSFEELYMTSYEPLVRLGYVMTGSRELAEDLVQDCFVRLHRHYDRLDSPERYARQAVVNACRSHFRRAGRERDRRPLLYVIDGDPGSSGPQAGELHDVLLTLPYRQRAAIVLRYYADLSEVEIAEVLGCRPGTVGSLIHRGLERLRQVIDQ